MWDSREFNQINYYRQPSWKLMQVIKIYNISAILSLINRTK